ncbi:hypothetical protein [Xanthomonas vesicatoria]|uniref:Uncharacterized protein n=1 Tax=Xanthomonas vesicatoria ATCC 35937 TaxID=925775 RepID=F0BE74_9XANT|nr:hypothetical protein [Xanthomonas vesicatoria]APP76217.1 hypothetical protein BJD12_14410 [Xanthomonas vesicatoria ATCC 35937]EGD09224.1 hypothetical protein XVE_2501 [Xanthomonas vesicatoria ATCC 35937]KTF29567.1 hypothetical protein LMG920_22055 [Xanthomonas vesicatoria]KTF30673.1 hypothetical protein LMG919_20735 [Xanthomonas vesicatoria]MCC8558240.1 hypothetical protein [Xanthomonas vesicatoria]
MATELYPLTEAKLNELSRPTSERIMKWRFFNAQKGVETTKQDGSVVSIHGVKYAGSVPLVYWSGFFEPFMIHAASENLKWVSEHCKANRLDPAAYIDEARLLVHDFIRKSYTEIARTDQLLRGNGFPDTVTPRNVSGKAQAACDQVDQLAKAYLLSGPPMALVAREDILELKPNLWGIGLNLNAAWRRFRAKVSGP